jgi:hypothetical protein
MSVKIGSHHFIFCGVCYLEGKRPYGFCESCWIKNEKPLGMNGEKWQTVGGALNEL